MRILCIMHEKCVCMDCIRREKETITTVKIYKCKVNVKKKMSIRCVAYRFRSYLVDNFGSFCYCQ